MGIKKILITCLLLLFATGAYGLDKSDMQILQEYYCTKVFNGTMEVVLKDKTRADCIEKMLGRTVVYEFEWAQDWYQAVGQVLHYTTLVAKGVATIVLFYNGWDEEVYVDRLDALVKHYKLSIIVNAVDISGGFVDEIKAGTR